MTGGDLEREEFDKILESPERQKVLRDIARLEKTMRPADLARLRAASKS